MLRLTAALTTLLLVAVACSSTDPTPAPAAATTAPATASAAPQTASGPNIIPILANSELAQGPNRFLFGLTDTQNQLVADPEVEVRLRFYDESRDPETVVFDSDSRFVWAIEGVNGLYAADVIFPHAGRWATRFDATFPDGTAETVRASYDVREITSTPMIGAPAPSVDSPVADDVGGDLRLISTDPDPAAALYEVSIAEAIDAEEPFVVAFSTPAFCVTATCGPTLEMVKSVAAEHPETRFVHVEPYILEMGTDSLQPVLSDEGQLQTTPWTDAWGLLAEPFVAVVDGSGIVRAKFEGSIGADELERAIAAAGPAASPTGTMTGIVLEIEREGLGKIDRFTLHTEEGQSQVFLVGATELDGGAFPPNHLREHMGLAEPIVVTYAQNGAGFVATRLEDAAPDA